ncbi:hypothetical protein HF086_000215 [Spodoptera exigua]|uniref:ZAD domain-containing protein n=1 Tax=Spodoptera exigua TaxID=7107 RepID=A0A922ME31_SPOEX|nr:hypothetical protein HF086_000215 [Spodoptera exigua]
MTENNRNLKIHNTCRICLFTTDNVEQFVFLNEDNVWFERFEFCFGIKLTAQDQQHVLCLMCSIDIKKFICFKEKCLQSHRLWESLMSDVRCNIVKIDCIKNITENVGNTISKQIKSENLDPSSDNDQKILPDGDDLDNFIEIKIEHNENDDLRQQTGNDVIEKVSLKNHVKQKPLKKITRNDSAEIEGKKLFSCKKEQQ